MATETWVLNETRNVPITDPGKEITISGTMYSIVPNSPDDIQETPCTKVLFKYGVLNSSKYGLVYFYNPDYSGFYMSNNYASTGGTTNFTNNNDTDFWYSRNYTEMSNEQKLKFRTVTFDTAPTGDLLTWLRANATKQ